MTAVTTGHRASSPGIARTASAVLAALGTVRDPELDESITVLGFVSSSHVSDEGTAHVRLRLPTYFCAPNFAFLMVADAYDAVSAVDGVTRADVVLEEHFASDAINDGVAARAGFVRSFDGEAVAELGELRDQFLRKAVMAGTDLVCRPLAADGIEPQRLATLTLGEVAALGQSGDLDRLRQRREQLGLPAGDDAPLLVDPTTGDAVQEPAVPLHLRKARTTRTSLEANGSVCRGMLRHRYSTTGEGEEDL